MLVHVNSGEAMGANIVNTICERLSAQLLELLPCEVGLQILTNLNDRRRVRAVCEIPAESLSCPRFRGTEVIARIVRAHQFACHDPYRAATNNKGIMNGIDAVVIATGNDWRAVEAGAHAHAVSNGSYQPLAPVEHTRHGLSARRIRTAARGRHSRWRNQATPSGSCGIENSRLALRARTRRNYLLCRTRTKTSPPCVP